MTSGFLSGKALLLAIALLVHTNFSSAAQQWCSGVISELWIDSSGNVFVSPTWRADHLRVCNINDALASAGGPLISTTTCLSWLSLLRTGVAGAKNMTIFYADAPTCSAIPTYVNAPTPWYVMLR